MDLLGHKVKHLKFGIGTITECTDTYIFVEFAAKSCKFQYPSAFEKFLKAEDSDVQSEIMTKIEEQKQEEIKRKLADEELRKEKEELATLERNAVSKKTGYKAKPVIKTHREQGERSTFFVFQGNTFDEEYEGGYIWAPVSDENGYHLRCYELIRELQVGDIIFHGTDGLVQALSVVKDESCECKIPEELMSEDTVIINGRKVECEYFLIKNPIKTATYREDIKKFNVAKYSPFDKDGNGNTGYLYELNRNLAKIFLQATVEQNEYLMAEEFVQSILNEESSEGKEKK